MFVPRNLKNTDKNYPLILFIATIPNITSLRENLMENESSKHRGIHQTREQIFYR